MNQENRNLAKLGRDYWQKYVQINGYSFEPTDVGLKKLSESLNLKVVHLRRCISVYLEA